MRTMADQSIRLNVNGEVRSVMTEPERPLLEVLREELGLQGAKYGCGEAQCGACSVLVEGDRVFSCRTPVARVQGKLIRTIEGLAQGEVLHPVQQAFLEENAFQCGYCTAGMILTTVALLETNPTPSDSEIVEALDGNVCRCCAYPAILRAIRRAVGRKVR
jgi:aerobic-type carbon monoxide dehydrogenase small subunit (CoxS/CutS family)